jgi:dTDP-4-amino-4,6-dideoxygalactose transaminase
MVGIPAPIEEIKSFYDGFIIEDCALSLYVPGAGLKGDAAVWSFQAVKTISCGDGGMITTNNKDLYKKLKLMINFGIEKSTYIRSTIDYKKGNNRGYVSDFEVKTVGYKSYMNDIQAALCLSQLTKLDKYLEIRRHIQKRYNKELSNFIEIPPWSENVQWYCARVPKEHRDALRNYLASKNIHTAVHWKPLHLHPLFKQDKDFPVANSEWLKFITLPCHPAMTESDIDYVIFWIKEYFNNNTN